jgi:UDP-N-acetylmuramate: L-alanyl-gamma-D-glutamyl-meso-diaminopimelate ligase
LVITNIDFDHADIFSSVEDIEKEFLGLLNEMPEGSHVIAYYDHERVRILIKRYLTSKEAPVNVIWYGESEEADYQITSREVVSKLSEVEQRIQVKSKVGTIEYSFNLSGAHNAQNVLSSIIACSLVGLSKDEIQVGLNVFHPIKRRQQLISNENGILVFEDFAHHPKEVTVTLEGLREAYKPKRLIAVFEPRSNTSRKDFFKDDYLNALMTADVVILRDLDQNTTVYSGVSAEAKLLSVNSLSVSLVDKGKESYCIKDIQEIYTKVKSIAKSGDLVVLMSNGDFGGLPGMFK